MRGPGKKQSNDVRSGVIGTVALVASLVLGFTYQSIPFLSGPKYSAEFSDASGLRQGADVQVGGVTVGTVQSIELDGGLVRVGFDADTGPVQLTAATTAAIKVETVLGHRFIDLSPGTASDDLPRGATISVENTSSGYDITRSLEEATQTVSQTDTADLSGALEQISDVAVELPPDLQSQLSGLSRLSDTIASRDSELRELLSNAAGVTEVLANRDQQVAALMEQGNELFNALNNRSAAIHRVLVQSRIIADELTALSRENKDALGPTLGELDSLVETLNTNYKNIDQSLTGLDRYVAQFSDVAGSGPFFGVLLHNVLPANLAGQLPDSLGGPR